MRDRHEISDDRDGRRAFMAREPRDSRQNVDWLRGWDGAFHDSRLDEEAAQ